MRGQVKEMKYDYERVCHLCVWMRAQAAGSLIAGCRRAGFLSCKACLSVCFTEPQGFVPHTPLIPAAVAPVFNNPRQDADVFLNQVLSCFFLDY